MITQKLTTRSIEAKKTVGYYSDGANLYLRVTPSLTKSWVFIYKRGGRGGKRTELGLGAFPDVSLAEARHGSFDKNKNLIKDGAYQLNDLLKAGIDPLTERQRLELERKAAVAKAMTFKQCAEAYINAHQAGWKNKKHLQQWQNTLSQYVYPVFGDLDVKAIDTELITKCLEPIWLIKNETAGRVRGRIESVLDWAMAKEHRPKGDNPARWRGLLDKLLAKPSNVQDTEHHKALPYGEINSFMNSLRLQGKRLILGVLALFGRSYFFKMPR